MMASLGLDLREAWRSLRRAPALVAVVVASMAVGVGVNTVVFSWLQARVLQPIPGVRGGAAFRLIEPRTDAGLYPGASWPEYVDLREGLQSFRELLAFRMQPFSVGEPGRVERTFGLLVSDTYFSALGVEPVLGRALGPDDGRPGAAPVAVVSYGSWRARLGGAPDAVGRTLRVNGRILTVIGVAPPEFQGTVLGLGFDLWVPAALAPALVAGSREREDREVRGYTVMGLLAPGANGAQAQGEVDEVMRALARIHPAANGRVQAEVLPFSRSPRGPQRLLTAAIGVLQAIMLLLMLAVCGNTATLVLARASARHRDVGVRLALGASRWRIARLVLLETALLALAGAGLGALFAAWGTRALQVVPLSGLPLRFDTRVDASGLAFAIGLGALAALLAGAVPAVQLARLDPSAAFRTASRTAGRSRLRSALVGIQVALALLVLIAGGLFVRSFLDTRHADPGFRREGVLLATYDFSGRGVTAAAARTFADRLLRRLRALPGVDAAALAASVPLDIHGLPARTFQLEGRTRQDGSLDEALANVVSDGYFESMGIPRVEGADFAPLDDPNAPAQAIVNEAFVRRYLEGAAATGWRLRARGRDHTIVGVVATSVSNAFGEPPSPAIYFSYRDAPATLTEIHLRARGGSARELAAEVRRVVRDLDAELPVFNVRTLAEHVDTNLVFRRVPARMFLVLGPWLLALAATGIAAVVAHGVSRRKAEIGVRMAMGATARRVVAGLVRESLAVVVAGALISWALALVVAMDVVPGGRIDVVVFTAIPVVLLAAAAVAAWIPARRAARVDPVAALREP
jgi:predicted permease